jgi:hypothetical protein
MYVPAKAHILLLWSEETPRGNAGFYKHFVPPGRRWKQPIALIWCANFRVVRCRASIYLVNPPFTTRTPTVRTIPTPRVAYSRSEVPPKLAFLKEILIIS